METDWSVPHVPNDSLVLDRIPMLGADWEEIERFALSFHANDQCAFDDLPDNLANATRERYDVNGALPLVLTTLRICLFFEQRRWRHLAEIPEDDDLEYVLALVDGIREAVSLRDSGNVPVSCRKCSASGLAFGRRMFPEDFIEGSPDARVWIVGLNPAGDSGAQTAREANEYFSTSIHPYFNDFRKVAPGVYEALGRRGGTAHTDLVKCWSARFPPPGCTGKAADALVRECLPHLELQIRMHHPEVLICNGAAVSDWVKKFLPPDQDIKHMTSYTTMLDGRPISIVLSGFIGRIDDYAKARLGREVESLIDAARAEQRFRRRQPRPVR